MNTQTQKMSNLNLGAELSKQNPTEREIRAAIQAAHNAIDHIDEYHDGARQCLEAIENEVFNAFVNQFEINIGWLTRCDLWSFATATAHKRSFITRIEFQNEQRRKEEAELNAALEATPA